ncbi:hypothetical protein KIPB_001760 [Kipferlia bialata]|uniref:Uncharacterized protein n=1 Tax=Kipferlia bialata TaxID=797122 RepID=A0A9K3CQT2_9EUKA|nr:hypothetical protein KIPB_001760 [Kipferlia bialata]|eukprot:g1760.t1
MRYRFSRLEDKEREGRRVARETWRDREMVRSARLEERAERRPLGAGGVGSLSTLPQGGDTSSGAGEREGSGMEGVVGTGYLHGVPVTGTPTQYRSNPGVDSVGAQQRPANRAVVRPRPRSAVVTRPMPMGQGTPRTLGGTPGRGRFQETPRERQRRMRYASRRRGAADGTMRERRPVPLYEGRMSVDGNGVPRARVGGWGTPHSM